MQGSVNFVPDNPVASPSSGNSSGGGKVGGIADVAMLVSIVLLASSLAIATGVFLYGRLVDAQLNRAKTSLDRVRNNFDKNTIETLKLLSKRMVAGNDVLSKHIAVSEVFKALENLTLKSVQFEEFKFERAGKDELKIHLSGRALTVNAVAAQSKAFATNQDKFQNVIFSNLGFEKDGTVSFDVVADVNPDFINFTNIVLNQINSGTLSTTPQNSVDANSSSAAEVNMPSSNTNNVNFQTDNNLNMNPQNTTKQNPNSDSTEANTQVDEFGIPVSN